MVIGEDEKGANIAHLDRSLVENQDHAGQHPHFDVFLRTNNFKCKYSFYFADLKYPVSGQGRPSKNIQSLWAWPRSNKHDILV